MTWTLLDSGSVGFADGNTGHLFTFGAGAVNPGDLLIVLVSSNTTVSTPGGWSLAISDVLNLGAYFFYKKAAGGETSVTVTTAGNFPTALGYLRYDGSAVVGPLDVVASARNTVSNNTTPAVATGVLQQAGELSVGAACLAGLQNVNQTGITWNAGYTNRIDVTSGGLTASDQHLFIADNRNAGTAAQSPNASWTGNTNNQTILVATFLPSGSMKTQRGGRAVSNKTQFVFAANGTSAAWDANGYYNNIGFDVTASGGATLWNVQLQGSMDNVNFSNIGFPTASAGTLGTTIGPVTQGTSNTAFWGQGSYRYFRFVTTTLNAGQVLINLAVC